MRDLLGLPEQAARRARAPLDVREADRRRRRRPTYHLDDDGIGLAGDAFGKPRVQSAWRSGRDLGRALAARLA